MDTRQSAYQDQQRFPQASMPQAPPIMSIAQDQAIFRRLLNPSELLKTIEHRLKGEVQHGQKWIKMREPLCSDGFIDEVMAALSTTVSPEIITSNLNEWDINAIMRDVCRTTAKLLLLEGENEGVPFQNYNLIYYMIEHLTFATLKRAEGGGTLKFLTTTHQYSYAEASVPKKDSRFSFNPLKLGK